MKMIHFLRVSGLWALALVGSSLYAESLPYQKPGAPIYMHAPEPQALETSEEAEYIFTFSSRSKGKARVFIRADEGLIQNLPDTLELDFKDGRVQLPVTLSAVAEGRYYLRFQMQMNGLLRSFSYGVNVGDAKRVAQMRSKSTSVGGVKSFKAKETIR